MDKKLKIKIFEKKQQIWTIIKMFEMKRMLSHFVVSFQIQLHILYILMNIV